MVSKHGKVVIYHAGYPLINLHNTLNMWSHENTWDIKNVVSPLSQCLLSPNLSEWWHTKMISHSSIQMTPHSCSCDVTQQIKCYISTCKRPVETKLRKVLTYRERPPPLALNNPLITWPIKVRWKFEKFVSLLSQHLWMLNLAGYWLWESAGRKHLRRHWLLIHLVKTALQKQHFLLMILLFLHTTKESVHFHKQILNFVLNRIRWCLFKNPKIWYVYILNKI